MRSIAELRAMVDKAREAVDLDEVDRVHREKIVQGYGELLDLRYGRFESYPGGNAKRKNKNKDRRSPRRNPPMKLKNRSR